MHACLSTLRRWLSCNRGSTPATVDVGSKRNELGVLPAARDPEPLPNFTDPQSIYDELRPRDGLKVPPVRLLRWSWVKERAAMISACSTDKERELLAIPRRQELEATIPEAFYTAEEVEGLARNRDGGQMAIVSVSHAWEHPKHPDPRAHTLEALAAAIIRAQTQPVQYIAAWGSATAKRLPSEMAIFFGALPATELGTPATPRAC